MKLRMKIEKIVNILTNSEMLKVLLKEIIIPTAVTKRKVSQYFNSGIFLNTVKLSEILINVAKISNIPKIDARLIDVSASSRIGISDEKSRTGRSSRSVKSPNLRFTRSVKKVKKVRRRSSKRIGVRFSNGKTTTKIRVESNIATIATQSSCCDLFDIVLRPC